MNVCIENISQTEQKLVSLFFLGIVQVFVENPSCSAEYWEP